eukprot:356183-Heterocapsa_arctica.AAC.1
MAWYPAEADAVGMDTLARVVEFTHLPAPALDAFERQVGALADSVMLLALLPPDALRLGAGAARVVTVPAAEDVEE